MVTKWLPNNVVLCKTKKFNFFVHNMDAVLCEDLVVATQTHGIWNVDAKLDGSGGQHIIYEQYIDNNVIDNDVTIPSGWYAGCTPRGISIKCEYPTYLQPFLDVMVQFFMREYPNVIIKNYILENLSYIMYDEPFTGNISDNYCEYTVICHYEIGSGIHGGELNIYSNDNVLLNTLKPNVGGINICNGLYNRCLLSTTPESIIMGRNRLSVLQMMINSFALPSNKFLIGR